MMDSVKGTSTLLHNSTYFLLLTNDLGVFIFDTLDLTIENLFQFRNQGTNWKRKIQIGQANGGRCLI